MRIVAGPPGSGKSCAFPVAAAGFGRHFNADDEAMLLNHGSYQNIPIEVRRAVNARFEEFINDCIAEGDSFTFETTLRTTITFDQARRARANGFFTYMRYLGAAIDVCIERVKIRADADGHSAPESFLRATYAASMKNRSRRFGRWIGWTSWIAPATTNRQMSCSSRKRAALRFSHLPFLAGLRACSPIPDSGSEKQARRDIEDRLLALIQAETAFQGPEHC
jgi:predicted ABC-type ATPase